MKGQKLSAENANMLSHRPVI